MPHCCTSLSYAPTAVTFPLPLLFFSSPSSHNFSVELLRLPTSTTDGIAHAVRPDPFTNCANFARLDLFLSSGGLKMTSGVNYDDVHLRSLPIRGKRSATKVRGGI